MARAAILAAMLAACAACSPQSPTLVNEEDPVSEPAGNADVSEPVVNEPVPAPSEPSHAANENAADPRSSLAAAALLEAYGERLGRGDFSAARRLWSDDGRSSGLSEEAFQKRFERYEDLSLSVGAPGRIEGAAGSSYVEIPVRFQATLDGSPFSASGTAVLRRVNDVPGSTAEQRQWRIYRLDVQPPL